VARYYFSRGAYVAAINRAQSALTDYREVPAAEEALFLLYRSYDALGMVQLRDDTLRIMQKSYPDSAFTQGASASGKAPKGAWFKFW
jgi:outer membrane protein assembly factor BamD